jgi:hypothetical protein
MSTKGPQFEREMAGALSRWWTAGERDDLAWRTAGSGARATTRAKKGKTTANAAGDLAATDAAIQPLFDVFAFELKRGLNAVSPFDLLFRPRRKWVVKRSIDAWVGQASLAAAVAGARTWAIVHRPDRQEAMVYADSAVLQTLFPYLLFRTAGGRVAAVTGRLVGPDGTGEPQELLVIPFADLFPPSPVETPLITVEEVKLAAIWKGKK